MWRRSLASTVLGLVVLVGLSASPAVTTAATASVEDLLDIACGSPPELVPEIRAAAAAVLSEALIGQSVAELEPLALNATRECRQAAVAPLVEAYIAEGAAPEGLLEGVATAGSAELAFARALAAIILIQVQLLLGGLPPLEELIAVITGALSGEVVEFAGFVVDGANPVIRRAVGTVVEEVFFALGRAVFGEAACDRFLELAIGAPTPEFRTTAARVYAQFSGCVPLEEEALLPLALGAPSEELREAVVEPLAEALANSARSNDELMALARPPHDGESTPQLRLAAGQALGLRWQAVVQADPATGHPVVDGLDLFLFAAANTQAFPELAAAAIAPIALFFLLGG